MMYSATSCRSIRFSSLKDHIGYGLQSVEEIAEKYDRGVEFTHEDRVFHSSAMMNLASFAVQD